ncbi:MAG: hypothetical protein EA397_00825 [Deltaproteobacteria bacterium]|nr:MAG: hypothetical protein EA397_00825 [Deltaproteobacteria bacterium]
MIASITFAVFSLCSTALAQDPSDGLRWTRDPGLVPWEVMTTSSDLERTPAQSRQDLENRRKTIKARLDLRSRSAEERAADLAELGDLFRDEARLVLQDDASDPWRIPLPTSPAWLQLELAARWYSEALTLHPRSVDGEGRLTLLQAVIASRLGKDDVFDDYVRVIRTYRGTPYVEMAKLAVGDHHYRSGDLRRARAAYRMVRENRDPELSSYARYRLASVHAALGEHDDARAMLEELLESPPEGALMSMLQEASRSALANQLARELPLPALIGWLHSACEPKDQACIRDVRTAAADTAASIGDDRADAWLRTVDASTSLEQRLDTRLDLVKRMLSEAPARELLFAAEDTCAPRDAPCRAEQAHAVMSFYDEVADPGGAWLPGYLRLPRLRDRPEVQRLAATLAERPRPATEELDAIEALCDDYDTLCKAELRVHLRAMWSRLDRLHDAAWLQFVDEPLPVPGTSRDRARALRLVRERSPASTLLRELSEPCGRDPACEQDLFEILVGYFAAIGEEPEAAWLIALKTLPAMPIPEAPRNALHDAALAGKGGLEILEDMLQTCAPLTPQCLNESRIAAEAFLRAASRHADAAEVQRLGLLTSRAVPAPAFEILVAAALHDPPPAEVLDGIASLCSGHEPECAIDARATLAKWYEEQERFADRQLVLQIDRPPDLGAYQRLGPAFVRLVRTTTDPLHAAERLERLCARNDADCPGVLQQALASWYENQGLLEEARAVRQRSGPRGFVPPTRTR